MDAAVAAQTQMASNPAIERRSYTVLGETSKYLFRSKPGVLRGEGHKITIPVREGWWDEPDETLGSYRSRTNAKAFAAAWERNNREESEGGRKPDGWKKMVEQAFLDNGGPKIRFKAMPPVYTDIGTEDSSKTEIYFRTDSDAIAGVLRQMMKDKVGYFAEGFIYEVNQTMHYKVGEKRYALTTTGLGMASDEAIKQSLPVEIEQKYSEEAVA